MASETPLWVGLFGNLQMLRRTAWRSQATSLDIRVADATPS